MPVAPIAPPQLRHLLNRWSYGATPELVGSARAQGGGAGWFEAQLRPGSVPDPFGARLRSWYPHLDETPARMYELEVDQTYPAWQQMRDFAGWTILRRAYSKRQLFESMVEFWSNLLHVPGYHDNAWPHRIGYDTVIRRHALGRYEDLLVAAVLHPGMGCYLDNAVSTRDSVNENLGREVLELHSVGVEAGYTEDDVRHSAYILTGYLVDMWDTWVPRYARWAHWTGTVSVLGFTDENLNEDGRAVTDRYLRYLANHPATAARVARKLCQRFVSDTPSPQLLAAVAGAFTDSGTDIRATLRALVAHPEFAASAGAKVRTPAQDAIAAYRLLGARPTAPTGTGAFAQDVVWQLGDIGGRPFDWPTPDGFPDLGPAWSSVGRVLASLDLHQTLAAGWWPSRDVTYPTVEERLPPLPARFDTIVDHVSRQLLQRPADPALQAACRQVLQLSPGSRFATAPAFGKWRMDLLLATVLNSPAHLAR